MANLKNGGDVEIKIITTDHQKYTMLVDKSAPVPTLKEQIAQVTGVVSDHQRLLCGGKLLTDDKNLSSYHVEDGHTLHLVVRQPVDPSPESDDSEYTDSSDSESSDSDSEPPVSDRLPSSIQRFDRMMEEYRAKYNVVHVPRRFDLNTRNLLQDRETYDEKRRDYLERVKLLERARLTLFVLLLRGAPEGPEIGRLRTRLEDVQNHLHDARLSLVTIEAHCESVEEGLLMSYRLEQNNNASSSPQASADQESSSPGNWLSDSFHRFLGWFSPHRWGLTYGLRKTRELQGLYKVSVDLGPIYPFR